MELACGRLELGEQLAYEQLGLHKELACGQLEHGMGLVCGILGLGGMVQHGGLEHDVHKLGHGLEHELEHGLQHRIFPWHKDCGHLVVQHGAGWRQWNDKIHGAYGQHGLQMERYHA